MSSSVIEVSSTGSAYSSSTQAPKSSSLHLTEQNGLYSLPSYGVDVLQIGHLTSSICKGYPMRSGGVNVPACKEFVEFTVARCNYYRNLPAHFGIEQTRGDIRSSVLQRVEL